MPSDGPYRRAPRASSSPKPGEYACPACLTPVRDDARACPRCGAPIATVRCAECFHMNIPEAVLCTACGHELGLSPAGEPARLDCPDCRLPLEIFRGDGGELHDCGRCGGQFVEHPLLEALLARRESFGRASRKRPVKSNPLDSPVRYLKCPECGEVMMRKNFGGTSGIIVDICRRHGTWFDPRELPRVLAFVEAGGLEATREASEAERIRQERLRQLESSLAGMRAPIEPFGRARATAAVTEASSLLLDFVRALLAGR